MIEAPSKLFRINTKNDSARNGDCISRVGVLMSTYNGERYLRDQIDSIASQEGVEIEMFVRDDGSSDATVELLRNVSEKPFGSIVAWHVEYGENIGFLDSFKHLLAVADGCEGYCFSDQDDFWLPKKLQVAMRQLKSTVSAALYASTVTVTDEQLNQIGNNYFPNYVYSIPAEFIRHRLSGHTMVWNESLQCALRDNTSNLSCWTHDQLVVISALLAGAPLYLDDESYVLHRRLSSSVTPGGTGMARRLQHELRVIWNPNYKRNRSKLAKDILDMPSLTLSDEDCYFLQTCAARKRVSFAANMHFDCGLAMGNLEARVSMLLGRF